MLLREVEQIVVHNSNWLSNLNVGPGRCIAIATLLQIRVFAPLRLRVRTFPAAKWDRFAQQVKAAVSILHLTLAIPLHPLLHFHFPTLHPVITPNNLCTTATAGQGHEWTLKAQSPLLIHNDNRGRVPALDQWVPPCPTIIAQ